MRSSWFIVRKALDKSINTAPQNLFRLKSFSTFQSDISGHAGYYNLSYNHKDKEIRYLQCNCLFAFVIIFHIF